MLLSLVHLFFYFCVATRVQIISYALPVATQRKQKYVNQALHNTAHFLVKLIGAIILLLGNPLWALPK